MSVSLVPLPANIQTKVINSTDTNPIAVIAASPGKVVRVWGMTLTGGTSILVGSNATPLTGVMTTTGLAHPLPRGVQGTRAYAYYESNVGETINITPGASGLNGVIYFTQD